MAVQNLGRLDELDDEGVVQGSILWERFAFIGERRRYGSELVIRVEDLGQSIATTPPHYLDLHLIDAKRIDVARLERGFAVTHPGQPQVLATGRAGNRLVLLCEPTQGRQLSVSEEATGTDGEVASAGLRSSALLQVGRTLAGLLVSLHEAGVHGVHLRSEQLRVDANSCALDSFFHLSGPVRTREQDIAALIHMLGTLGLDGLDDARSGDAGELLELLRARAGGSETFEPPSELPFVGRDSVLSALEAGISQARIARPTTLVVSGERGIGKSRLLREFVAKQVESNDFLVLTGAWQTESGDTRSALRGALEQLPKILPRLDPDERDDIRRRIERATRHLGAIVTRTAPTLSTVLRSAEELPQLEMSGDFSRHTAVIADVLKCLGTRQRPLLLVLDNLENIDANSAAVLEIVAQSRPAHYTLILMGMRVGTRDVNPERFNPELVGLEPLTSNEVGELLTRTLPGEISELDNVVEQLCNASEGIPLRVGATFSAWLDQRRLQRQGEPPAWALRGQSEDNYLNVRDIYGARLTSLPELARTLALDIAVFGAEVESEIVDELTADAPDELEQLRERGILINTRTGVRFPHDTVREVVLSHFEDTEARRKAHRRAATILAANNASVPQIVYHRDFGIEADEPPEAFDKLSRLHVEAGRDRLAVYDLERARWHLERALDHSHDPEQRELAAEGLADICLLQEDIDEAVSLYTAIIYTSKPSDAVRVAGKAVQFLYGKNANTEAKQLGNMALEVAKEPTPSTPFGKIYVLLGSLARSWFGECQLDEELRDGLCHLYMYMAFIALIEDPISVLMYTFRGRWAAIGLEAGSAAISRSLEAGLLTVMGWVNTAGRVFQISNDIAHKANDAWAQGMVFHHWGGALLALDRYSEGQDRLDDGIAAFRETGDISIALISMFYKSVYGRDREHADVVLGWIEEGMTTARRNGKRSGVATLQGLKMHIFARQGRRDLDERLDELAETLEGDEVPGIERLGAQIHLAFAYLEHGDLDKALVLMRAAQAHAGELGETVPEWCQEVHLLAAHVLLALPMPSRAEQKELRAAIRKFGRAGKSAPRLAVLHQNLELQLAIANNKVSKAHELASKIVSDFEQHENLYVARQAHRALARFNKGSNVLASAEHDRLARNLGRRLGFLDHVLLSDFQELGREVGILALTEESEFKIEESQHNLVPAAGMLKPVVQDSAPVKSSEPEFNDQSDVLEAWALTDSEAPEATLGSLIDPVRQAVGAQIDASRLKFSCPDPERTVPFESSDLQLLMINMLLASRDAVGPRLEVNANLEVLVIEDSKELERLRLKQPGEHLSIHISATGPGTQTPVIGAFGTCENLVNSLGGVLSATTAAGKMSLRANIPIVSKPSNVKPKSENTGQVVIVHDDEVVCDTLGSSLNQLGLGWKVLPPKRFGPSDLQGVTVVLASSEALDNLQLLAPLTSARLVEVVRHGTDPMTDEFPVLRVPFEISELEDIIR